MNEIEDMKDIDFFSFLILYRYDMNTLWERLIKSKTKYNINHLTLKLIRFSFILYATPTVRILF